MRDKGINSSKTRTFKAKFKRFFDKNRNLLDNFLKIDKIKYKINAEGLKLGHPLVY